MASLREVCYDLIRNDIFLKLGDVAAKENGAVYGTFKEEDCSGPLRLNLICDDSTLATLGSVCKMSDLYELGVTNVERISDKRTPVSQLDAVYFLSPTSASINQLLQDFENVKKPQHDGVHFVFTGVVSKELFQRIASSPGLAPRVKSFREVPLDVVFFGKGAAFHHNDPKVLSYVAGDAGAIDRGASCLKSVCDALQIRPAIRFARTGSCSVLARELAAHHRANPLMRPSGKSLLLIVDRSIDVQAALCHESTYEALVYDVIPGVDLQSGVVEVGGKEQLLHDALFDKLRYMHFLDSKVKIQEEIENFRKRNKNVQKIQAGDKDLDLKDMIATIRAVPEYQEQYQSFELHADLNRMILVELEKRSIIVPQRTDNSFQLNAGTLEQEVSTGLSDEGKEVKVGAMAERLSQLFTEKPLLTSEVKLRLVLLYFATFTNVTEKSRRAVVGSAQFTIAEETAVRAFMESKLLAVETGGKGNELRKTKEQLSQAKKDYKNCSKLIGRFRPRLQQVMESLVDDTLDGELFPVLGGDDVPRRGSTPRDDRGDRGWGWGNAAPRSGGDKTKVIVYVAGGLTLSEIRAAQEVMEKKGKADILIGGSCILTPSALLVALGAQGVDSGDVTLDVDLT